MNIPSREITPIGFAERIDQVHAVGGVGDRVVAVVRNGLQERDFGGERPAPSAKARQPA